MSKGILISIARGIIFGAVLLPNISFGGSVTDFASGVLPIVLCILLLLVGFEIGRDTTVKEKIQKVGFRVFLFPVAAISGTFIFAAIASAIIPFSPREAMAAAGGFGWYSIAPNILMAHSTMLSAICFLHNVMRELFGIVLIPFVAKWVGYIEATALPGVAAPDVCLPIIEKATSSDIAIYAIIMGFSMGFVVPWVGVIVGV